MPMSRLALLAQHVVDHGYAVVRQAFSPETVLALRPLPAKYASPSPLAGA